MDGRKYCAALDELYCVHMPSSSDILEGYVRPDEPDTGKVWYIYGSHISQQDRQAIARTYPNAKILEYPTMQQTPRGELAALRNTHARRLKAVVTRTDVHFEKGHPLEDVPVLRLGGEITS